MKIILASHRFSPDVGGIETTSAILASEFVSKNHDIRVVTRTSRQDTSAWPFEVIRLPSASELLAQARWCDVFLQNNISLQSLWAPLIARRPCVVAFQTWITQVDGGKGWREYVKRAAARVTTNVAISKAVADEIGAPSTLIPNPYRDEIFYLHPDLTRDLDLVFLGRLVSDKGVDLLLRALVELSREGLHPRLSIVGGGPEEASLRALAAELGLDSRVAFHGLVSGAELATLLNRHKVMVVPSRWAEPFGIVALEGIACGCVVIGSNAGGLGEAIGPCGLTYPNGDASALASCLHRVFSEPGLLESLRAGAERHLARHTAHTVASAYLQVLAAAVR
jgi:glycosyltransferase involved in cell wall biosynthesis